MKYSRNVEYLVSSIIYLGTHEYYWARSPSNLANELSVSAVRLQEIFEGFPGLYRRSKQKSDSGEYFYSLQARYAQREGGDVDEPDQISYIEPLTTERIQMLIDFVLHSAERETASARTWVANTVSMGAAVVAALAAVFAALLARGQL